MKSGCQSPDTALRNYTLRSNPSGSSLRHPICAYRSDLSATLSQKPSCSSGLAGTEDIHHSPLWLDQQNQRNSPFQPGEKHTFHYKGELDTFALKLLKGT